MRKQILSSGSPLGSLSREKQIKEESVAQELEFIATDHANGHLQQTKVSGPVTTVLTGILGDMKSLVVNKIFLSDIIDSRDRITRQIIKFTIFFLIAGLLFVSCKKEKDNANTNTVGISSSSKEYDLDIPLSATFSFIKNYNNPWDYGAPNPDDYYDFTEIIGTGFIAPFGEFNIYIEEYADTAALNYTVFLSYFLIVKGNIDPLYIEGYSSINFKKLIRQGGGSFTGTFTVIHGSARFCNAANLPPLIVTGSLDVSSHTINLRIKGKACF